MKKVLFIMHYPPPLHGASMVGGQIKNSVWVNNHFQTKYINLGTSKHVNEINRTSILKHLRFTAILFKVLAALLFFRPKTVYMTPAASGIGFYKDAVIALLTKLFVGRLILHFHNKGVSERQKFSFDNFLYGIVLANTKVLLVSKKLYSDIKKYVKEEDVYYCPNGIPDINAGNREGKTIQKKEAVTHVLFLSNLLVSKGVFVLLDACRLLCDKGIIFKMFMVGAEGNIDSEQLNAKINSYGLEDHVEYLGRKYGEEKFKEYERADIFVFPSFDETFGIVNLEAMRQGLPVLSTLEGGIPDIVKDGETGFLVPVKDVDLLAQKLEILINQPKLRLKMGKLGRERFLEHFTDKKFEEKFIAILKDILE